MRVRAASLGFIVFLSACFGLDRVDELRHAPRAPSAFDQHLAQLYLQFVDNELDKYDWDTAGYFAGKGLAAARGEQVKPEDPELWDIPEYAIDELRSARASVAAKLTPAFRAAEPKTAAEMLFHFDCWVEEQEEAWETSAIEACKRGVLLHMQETDPPVAMGGPLSTSYLFHFPEGETRLEGMAREELALIADTVTKLPTEVALVINGHADRTDGAGDARELSARRAGYIRDFLALRGVPGRLIHYQPYSDSAAGDTMDANRRIEIFIE